MIKILMSLSSQSELLQASMWGGQQMTGVTLSQGDLQDLEKCARSVERYTVIKFKTCKSILCSTLWLFIFARLAASMQEYKLDFTKVAHLLVAEFADCSQKVTLYSVIKASYMSS